MNIKANDKGGELRNDCAVVVTVDRKFLPFGLFLLNQIADGHPDRSFDLCIFTADDLQDHPLFSTLGVRIVKMPIEKLSADFAHSDRISVATYLRFYLAGIMGDEYRRVLYLDSDIFYRRGDIDTLLKSDIGDNPLAGARDPIQFRRKGFVHKDMAHLGYTRFPYLSAGVQLIDTKRYRELEIAENAIKLASTRSSDMLVYDQTALNAVLQGQFAELPPGWNWLYGFRTIYFTELYDPPFLHFAGKRKPWDNVDATIPAKYSKAYKDFFADHFPEFAAQMPSPKPPSSAKAQHLRFLLNHISGVWRLLPSLDEFKGDFDIRIKPT